MNNIGHIEIHKIKNKTSEHQYISLINDRAHAHHIFFNTTTERYGLV